ncbi:hypothetical protein TWF281_003213 [Arthrobotrys megalospora]
MHIRRRQLITSSWPNPADPPAESKDTPTSQPEENTLELANRDAGSNSQPTTDPEAGGVVAHRLDQTYPDIPRPTPIKVQTSGGDSSTTAVNNDNGETFQDHSIKPVESNNENKENDKSIDDIAATVSLPGLPLGMLGPLMGPTNSISGVNDDNDGDATSVVEIEVMPTINGMFDIPATSSPGGDNMVEEIWITGSEDSSKPPGTGGDGFNPLDMLANELESMMGGIFGTKGKSKPEQPVLGQPIDEVMLPNGLPQRGPEVPVNVSFPGGEDLGAVKRGWGDMGKVVGIVMLSVLGPIIAITALGCGTVFLVKRVRAKRKGYKEVQSGLCGDEEWN